MRAMVHSRAGRRAMSSTALIVAAMALAIQSGGVQAAIHQYDRQSLYAEEDAFIFQGGREGMFGRKEMVHTNMGISNGQSYIKFDSVDITLPASLRNSKAHMTAVVFDLNAKDSIGVLLEDGESRRFCCDSTMEETYHCEPGHVLIQPSEDANVHERKFGKDRLLYSITEEKIDIAVDGMYYLWFIACGLENEGETLDPELAPTITGITTWKNPYGYLPGMMSPYLKFYGIMCILYACLASVWFALYLLHWRDILMLQNCISAVIGLSMVELAAWYFDYDRFNRTGYRPYNTTVIAALLGALRKSVSRMLLLVVAMGYGVVRPTLGGLQRKVIALGLAYFAFSATYDIVLNVGSIDDLAYGARVFLVLPIAVCDAVFILWIFTALSKTLEQLQIRRQTAKLALYRKFTSALGICVLASVLWIIYETYFKITDRYNSQWQSDWIIQSFWSLLSFAVLCVICFLWAPSGNSTRYAYSDDLDEDFDDEAFLMEMNNYEPRGDGATGLKNDITHEVFGQDGVNGTGKLA